MKASALITRITGMRWLWKAILILALAAVFGYLYTRGVSPVWAARSAGNSVFQRILTIPL